MHQKVAGAAVSRECPGGFVREPQYVRSAVVMHGGMHECGADTVACTATRAQGHFQIMFSRHCPLVQPKLSVFMRIMYSSGVWSYVVGALTAPMYFIMPCSPSGPASSPSSSRSGPQVRCPSLPVPCILPHSATSNVPCHPWSLCLAAPATARRLSSALCQQDWL